MSTTQLFDFEVWCKNKRPKTAAYYTSLRGKTLTEEEFIKGYKELNLENTPPSKGRSVYKYLVQVGYINQ